ncbi:MAG: MoxR family ATPase [Eubacteriales bacterium]|nr:MoxR family ATPase [Eubacteriales bacterium]
MENIRRNNMEDSLDKARKIFVEVKKTIVGKNDVICKVLMAILADGHVLLEDIPGVGKTTMAEAFAKTLGLDYTRVQFTPDVMPSDITGFNMYNREKNAFEYKMGAAMCNVLLADEINRTSPKTQSALLQVMEERSISIDGKTFGLKNPFVVIATQNPVGSVGTQKLPESQMDRFMVCLSMGYPTVEEEMDILKSKYGNSQGRIKSSRVITIDELIEMKNLVKNIYVDDSIYEYTVKIAQATRHNKGILQGVSPRGSISLIAMAQAESFLRGHDYVSVSDIQNVAQDVLAHRIILKNDFKRGSISARAVIDDIVKSVEVPDIIK